MNREKKRKDQFVVAYLPLSEVAPEVIRHAYALALMLKKDIVLLHVADSRYKTSDIDETVLKSLEEHVNNGDPTLTGLTAGAVDAWRPHSAYCLLRKSTREAIGIVGDLLNGVVVVAAVNTHARRHTATHPKELLRNFSQCKTAYLTLQSGSTAARHPDYSRVAFAIDYSKESKEKLLWASYFARFNNSLLELFYTHYHDEGLRQKWNNNMRFLTKFFNSLQIGYTPHPMEQRWVLHNETRVVAAASKSQCSLIVSTTTDLRNKDILDLIAGTAEQRVIGNSEQLPVLFLNPRDDIYVLCD